MYGWPYPETAASCISSRDRETILSTTGTRAAIESLSERTQALEDAVLELTKAVQGLVQPK